MISPSQISSFFQNGISAIKGNGKAAEKEGAQKQAINDMLTLSSLSKQLDMLNGDELSGEGVSTEKINDLKERAQMMSNVLKMKMSQFEGKLMKSLQDAGISTEDSLILQDAGADGVKLLNEHPDAQRIAQLFAEDAPITREFQEISRLGALVNGLERAEKSGGVGVAAHYAQQSQDRWKLPATVATISTEGAMFAFE